jgi:hypothetical protein
MTTARTTGQALGIDQLRLSVQARAFLADRHIMNTDQLCSLNYLDLLRAPQLHRADVGQIISELCRSGLELSQHENVATEHPRHCPGRLELGLALHALLAADDRDTLMLELTVEGHSVARYDVLEALRIEADECEPANRSRYLQYTAKDLRRMADVLDQMANEIPKEA